MPDKTTEQELIELLSSDKRSLRIQAVVKLSRIGKTSAALQALSSLVSKGDREESFFASQAIAKISQKLNSKSSISQEISTESNLISEQSQKEETTLTSNDFLSVPKDKAPALLQYIRTKSNELPEDILPSVGVFLGKYGDVSDSEFIQKYLTNHQDNLTLPYISAAEKIDVKILFPVLPYLLASKESLVRSRAVMALRKIDPTEAERHFLHLLASTKAEDRLAALEISFLFPFDKVKSYIIALLQGENDADVFKACATVLASNPSLEIALKILDVLESTSAEQKKPVTAIFNIVSAAITSAKVLPPQEATPKALVATWKQQRLKKFLNDLEIQLCTSTGPKREAIINWIEKNKEIPDVSDFIEQLALNPQTEDVYQRLSNNTSVDTMILPAIDSIFEKAQNATSATPIKAVEKTNKENLNTNIVNNQPDIDSVQPQMVEQTNNISHPIKEESPQTSDDSDAALPPLVEETPVKKPDKIIDETKKQVIYLKHLDLDQFLKEKQKITELAEQEITAPAIRAEALNLLLKYSPSIRIKNLGLKALSDKDNRLQTVGFKILERVAPNILKEKLSDLLLSSDTNIRVRAIRFGLKVDSEKSIQALQKLISSEDQNHRSYAISCLALCPFESVYIILIQALIQEQYPLVAKQITSILISNPDPVILSALDKISVKITDPSMEMVISQARNELEEIINALPESQKQSKLEPIKLLDKYADKESKPYSVENVRKIANKNNTNKKTNNNETLLNNIKAFFENPLNCVLVFLGCAVFFGGLVAIFSEKKQPELKTQRAYNARVKPNERNVGKGSKIPSAFRMNKPCTIEGEVTNMISEASIVIVHQGREIMVKFKGKEAQEIKKGDKVSVTCIPYRENPHGIILSNGINISKI